MRRTSPKEELDAFFASDQNRQMFADIYNEIINFIVDNPNANPEARQALIDKLVSLGFDNITINETRNPISITKFVTNNYSLLQQFINDDVYEADRMIALFVRDIINDFISPNDQKTNC